MSAEKITGRALWATVACKVARELALCVGGFGHTIGTTAEEFGHAALMVEQHYGRRYEDLTGVNLAGVTDEPDLYRGAREEELAIDEDDHDAV